MRTTADSLYAEAGFVEPDDDALPDARLIEAIEAAEELTSLQRRALAEIYRAFIDANAVQRTRSAGRAYPPSLLSAVTDGGPVAAHRPAVDQRIS
jgi:hypothetical protein